MSQYGRLEAMSARDSQRPTSASQFGGRWESQTMMAKMSPIARYMMTTDRFMPSTVAPDREECAA